jgi:hypothetical protein
MHRIIVGVIFAGVLATTHLVLADSRAATASDQAQAEPEADQPFDPGWFCPGDHGHGAKPQIRRVGMSFIVAGCVLLLALLAGIVLDDVGIRRWQERHREEAGARERATHIDAGPFGVNI